MLCCFSPHFLKKFGWISVDLSSSSLILLICVRSTNKPPSILHLCHNFFSGISIRLFHMESIPLMKFTICSYMLSIFSTRAFKALFFVILNSLPDSFNNWVILSILTFFWQWLFLFLLFVCFTIFVWVVDITVRLYKEIVFMPENGYTSSTSYFFNPHPRIPSLTLEWEEGSRRERGRETSMWETLTGCLPYMPWLGIEPTT